MDCAERLCARCARHQQTCCQQRDIYVTPGDVERIAWHTGRQDFFEFRNASDPVYLDQTDDPDWAACVFQPDGSRRVLKRRPSGDCVFLGSEGCVLSGDVRPLVCRLYPYDYIGVGLLVTPAPGCPTELLGPNGDLFASVGVPETDARRWHRQLYAELRMESELTTCV